MLQAASTMVEPEISIPDDAQYVMIDIPAIQVAIPKQSHQVTDAELKEMVWEAHKDAIYASMKVQHTTTDTDQIGLDTNQSELDARQSELKNARRRLHLLDQISEVQRQFLQKKEPDAAFNYLLSCLLDLMDSEYGFIGQIKHEDDGTMYLQTCASTNIAWNAATQKFYEDNIEAGLKFYNLDSLFGHVMVHAVPVISNTPNQDTRASGIPEGHPPLNHFLGIPFFEPGGRVIKGMVGIANKPGGYSQDDVEFLEPFTTTCSNLIQAYGAMQENTRLIDTLEEKVKERTFELQLANARLQDANRSVTEASAAQLQDFACMSHEIRTPLNCIVGLSSLLLETGLTPQQMDSMRMIVTSGELLSSIVNDILDFSKLISGNFAIDVQPTDLQATLDAVVHSIEVKAKDRNIKLCTHYDPLVPKIIDTDGRRLSQILYNLLGNATKFSPDNGLVEFSISIHEPTKADPHHQHSTPADEINSACSYEPAASEQAVEVESPPSRCPFLRPTPPSRANDQCSDDSQAVEVESPPSRCPFLRPTPPSRANDQCSDDSWVSSFTSNGSTSCLPFPTQETQRYIRFVVKDYGKGIDRADFDKIFKPFVQASGETEKLYGGTGLGLAITSKLVEGMGGTISVDSETGKFAEFSVILPFSCPEADMEAMSRSLHDSRILVVNEDRSQRLPQPLVDAYKLNVVELDSCAELSLLTTVKGAIDPSRSYICLIHEDLFEHDDVARFYKAVPATTVLTFGPRYSVKDDYSQGHYRSLIHLLPSSFVHSLIQSRTTNDAITKLEITTTMSNNFADPHRTEAVPCYETLRVLIAEDDVINQKVLKSMLERLGIVNIVVVDDGKKAVEAAAEENWDLILMDMQMPVMDGIEATRLILKQDCGRLLPQIVFVTANAMENFEKEARAAGATGFICKPFNLKRIESFFFSFMSGKSFYDDLSA